MSPISDLKDPNATWFRQVTLPANAAPPVQTGRRSADEPSETAPPGVKWCSRKRRGLVPIEQFGGRDTKGRGKCLEYDRGCYQSTQEKMLAGAAAQNNVVEQ
jgi:hypothetical protein